MHNLWIEQKGPNGLLKTWKLRSEQGVLTLGRSRHSHLIANHESIKGMQGIFEYRNDKWYYINLDVETKHKQMKDGTVELCLEADTVLEIGETTLSIKVLPAKDPVFAKFADSEFSHGGAGRTPFQLFAVYSGEMLLQSEIIPVHQKFKSKYDLNKTVFTPEKSTDWKESSINGLRVIQRTVYLTDVEAMRHVTKDQLVDEDAKKPLMWTLAGASLLALLFLLSPKTNSLDDVLTPIPPQAMREIKMEKPKKQSAPKMEEPQPKEQPKQQVAQQQKPAPAAQKNAGKSQASSMIKSLASGRITQLVGKISASAARSANVVVTSGVAAGSKATGRALAALGSISKSGKDWSSEGKGTGVTISTNGIAGGKGTGSMGAMTTGKTGLGGVGLLEDEGEIVGGLDREIIAQYIRSQLGQILYCYERQLSATPDLYGKVAVRFTIGGDGLIETQRITDTTLRNATVEGCILQKVAKWKFPTPQGGTKVLVTYPFLFKSTN
jgi:outer membrane biosynthesis protein TonB